VHKNVLCASSAFFRESIDAVPAALASNIDSDDSDAEDSQLAMWLSSESPEMFELLVLWLYRRQYFRSFLEKKIAHLTPDGTFSPRMTAASASLSPTLSKNEARCRALHANLVKLHLFAADINMPALQDASMDLLQDLYLRCDWDVSPRFIAFLYGECGAGSAFRLRKWAVAMVAWTLSNTDPCSSSVARDVVALGSDEGDTAPTVAAFQALFRRHPHFQAEYSAHVAKAKENRTNIRVKNPQLRIPANRLRNDERHFGFRQCSFHSHRKVVGEGRCPHTLAFGNTNLSGTLRRTPSATSVLPRKVPAARKVSLDSTADTASNASLSSSPEITSCEVPPLRLRSDASFLDLD